jgi:hypothetical protein
VDAGGCLQKSRSGIKASRKKEKKNNKNLKKN